MAKFNEPVTRRLLDGALDALTRRGVDLKNIRTVWVPGSFEIPLIAKKLASRKSAHAIIGLGAIIKGETMHHKVIAAEVAHGMARVGLESGIPVIMGVITAETWGQAMDRAGGKIGNRGAEAAVTALDMLDTLRKL